MELNLQEAKEKTIEFLNQTSYSLVRPEFSKYDMMYIFTTENLSYLEKMNIQKKDALTVTGSFDQAFNLILQGAKSVCNFDCNILTVYLANLKLAAMNTLTYQEYLSFFSGENFLSYQTYQKIKPNLNSPYKEYWDFLYEHFSYSNSEMKKSRLFDKQNSIEKIILSNPYLKSEQNYNKTKARLKEVEITFEEKNLLEIGEGEKTYDIMLFSNIESYLIEDIYSTMSEQEFIDFIQNKASKQLNEGGVIQVAYNYGYKTRKKIAGNLLKQIVNKKYQYDKLEYLEEYKKLVFMGYTLTNQLNMSNNIQDCVYLYTKGKNINKQR